MDLFARRHVPETDRRIFGGSNEAAMRGKHRIPSGQRVPVMLSGGRLPKSHHVGYSAGNLGRVGQRLAVRRERQTAGTGVAPVRATEFVPRRDIAETDTLVEWASLSRDADAESSQARSVR